MFCENLLKVADYGNSRLHGVTVELLSVARLHHMIKGNTSGFQYIR